jgi:hypothetical protein
LRRPIETAALIRHVDYIRVPRNPSRIDAKRRDHFLQADFPVLIARHPSGFRSADNTPRALVFCFSQPCFRPARALLQLRELSGCGAIEEKSERKISALDIPAIYLPQSPHLTSSPPKQEGRKPAPGCGLCLSAVRPGVGVSRLHDHSWRPCLPDFIQTVPRSPLRTRSGNPRPWYPRIALVHPLSTDPARWGIRFFAQSFASPL